MKSVCKANVEHQDQLAQPANQERLEIQDHRAGEDRREETEKSVLMANQVLKVLLVLLGPQENEDQLDRLVKWGTLVRKDRKENLGCRVLLVALV